MSNNKKTAEKHRQMEVAKKLRAEDMSRSDIRHLTWPMLHDAYTTDLSPYGRKLKAKGYI